MDKRKMLELLPSILYNHRNKQSDSEFVIKDISTPKGIRKEHWPISFGDLEEKIRNGEGTMVKGNSVKIDIEEKKENQGVELMRVNSTGGNYVDLDQWIGISGEITFTGDIEDIENLDVEVSELEFFCDINAKNGRSYSGETPPF